MISESEYLAPVVLFENAKVASQIIYSNVAEVVEQQQYVFDTLWNKALPAEEKIREIEEGVKPDKTEVIPDTRESISRALDIMGSAEKEVLAIFATYKTFALALNMGVDQIYMKATKNGAKVRLLIPDGSEQIEQTVNELKSSVPQVYVKIADRSLQTKITILVVDRTELMTWELRDDSIEDPYQAGGLATYSHSKSIALSYAAIFENLWKQTELYEQLKESKERLEEANEQLRTNDKRQKEFINIAAHELRTPIQPIIGLTEVVYSKTKDTEQRQLLDAVIRNSKRLQRLTERMLDVARIESQTLKLNKERFNINEKIRNVVNDIIIKSKEDEIEITIVEPQMDPIIVEADKIRIYEVISNLLTNAIKFTKKKRASSDIGGSSKDIDNTITISTTTTVKSNQHEENKDDDDNNNNNNNKVIISIKDMGTGIDSDIQERLFTKFATKSDIGLGLGLFISKNIIEAHGGKLWAENNSDGRGATFSFTLPIETR